MGFLISVVALMNDGISNFCSSFAGSHHMTTEASKYALVW